MSWREVLSWEEIPKEELDDWWGYTTESFYQDGVCYYDLFGKLHNSHGPAKVKKDGSVEYYKHGERHRTDGPAVIVPHDDMIQYWVNGEFHTEEEFNRLHGQNRQASLQVKSEEFQDEYLEDWQGFYREVKYEDGTFYRYNKKEEYHNTKGPAVLDEDGTVWYYQNGKCHRTDGPAIIRSDGTVYYSQNDKLHRTDGPAIIWDNGMVEYWVNGKKLSEEEFNEKYGRNRQASLKLTWEEYPKFKLGDRVRIGLGRTEIVYRTFPDFLPGSGAERDSAIASRNAFYDKLENVVGTITYVFNYDNNELPQYRVELDDYDLHQTMRLMIGGVFYGHQLDKV